MRNDVKNEGGISIRPQPIASANMVYADYISASNPMDKDKPKRLMSIQWSEAIIIIASTLES